MIKLLVTSSTNLKDVIARVFTERQQTLFLTHNVQDVVSYQSGSDGALFGVTLQYLEHGLQLVQGAVLTLLTDELSTHRLKNIIIIIIICLLSWLSLSVLASFSAFFSLVSFLPIFPFLPTLPHSHPTHRALSQSSRGLLDVVHSHQV